MGRKKKAGKKRGVKGRNSCRDAGKKTPFSWVTPEVSRGPLGYNGNVGENGGASEKKLISTGFRLPLLKGDDTRNISSRSDAARGEQRQEVPE